MSRIIQHFKENWVRHGFETLVVIVGILVAFTLNNWNETRKDQKKEEKILAEIHSDLKTNRDELRENIDFQIQQLELTRKLKAKYERGICDDSIGMMFGYASHDIQFYPKSSGYEALRSLGLNILRNDSLRKAITDLYALRFPRVVQLGIHEYEHNPMTISKIHWNRYADLQEGFEFKVPVNDTLYYEQKIPRLSPCNEFLNDKEVHNLIIEFLAIRTEFISTFSNVLKELDEVLLLIEQEE